MNTSSYIKYGVMAFLISAVLLGLIAVNGWIGVQNASADYEAEIPAQMSICATKVDAGYQTIQLQYQINQSQGDTIKGYLAMMFQSAVDPNGQETFAQSQNNLITAVMQYSVLGNTDLNALALNVQDTVATVFSEFSSCLGRANALKAEYKKALTRWPNSIFADQLNLPNKFNGEGANMPKRDIDGDGYLTVFDYQTTIVSSLTAGTFDTGQLPQLVLPTQAP